MPTWPFSAQPFFELKVWSTEAKDALLTTINEIQRCDYDLQLDEPYQFTVPLFLNDRATAQIIIGKYCELRAGKDTNTPRKVVAWGLIQDVAKSRGDNAYTLHIKSSSIALAHFSNVRHHQMNPKAGFKTILDYLNGVGKEKHQRGYLSLTGWDHSTWLDAANMTTTPPSNQGHKRAAQWATALEDGTDVLHFYSYHWREGTDPRAGHEGEPSKPHNGSWVCGPLWDPSGLTVWGGDTLLTEQQSRGQLASYVTQPNAAIALEHGMAVVDGDPDFTDRFDQITNVLWLLGADDPHLVTIESIAVKEGGGEPSKTFDGAAANGWSVYSLPSWSVPSGGGRKFYVKDSSVVQAQDGTVLALVATSGNDGAWAYGVMNKSNADSHGIHEATYKEPDALHPEDLLAAGINLLAWNSSDVSQATFRVLHPRDSADGVPLIPKPGQFIDIRYQGVARKPSVLDQDPTSPTYGSPITDTQYTFLDYPGVPSSDPKYKKVTKAVRISGSFDSSHHRQEIEMGRKKWHSKKWSLDLAKKMRKALHQRGVKHSFHKFDIRHIPFVASPLTTEDRNERTVRLHPADEPVNYLISDVRGATFFDHHEVGFDVDIQPGQYLWFMFDKPHDQTLTLTDITGSVDENNVQRAYALYQFATIGSGKKSSFFTTIDGTNLTHQGGAPSKHVYAPGHAGQFHGGKYRFRFIRSGGIYELHLSWKESEYYGAERTTNNRAHAVLAARWDEKLKTITGYGSIGWKGFGGSDPIVIWGLSADPHKKPSQLTHGGRGPNSGAQTVMEGGGSAHRHTRWDQTTDTSQVVGGVNAKGHHHMLGRQYVSGGNENSSPLNHVITGGSTQTLYFLNALKPGAIKTGYLIQVVDTDTTKQDDFAYVATVNRGTTEAAATTLAVQANVNATQITTVGPLFVGQPVVIGAGTVNPEQFVLTADLGGNTYSLSGKITHTQAVGRRVETNSHYQKSLITSVTLDRVLAYNHGTAGPPLVSPTVIWDPLDDAFANTGSYFEHAVRPDGTFHLSVKNADDEGSDGVSIISNAPLDPVDAPIVINEGPIVNLPVGGPIVQGDADLTTGGAQLALSLESQGSSLFDAGEYNSTTQIAKLYNGAPPASASRDPTSLLMHFATPSTTNWVSWVAKTLTTSAKGIADAILALTTSGGNSTVVWRDTTAVDENLKAKSFLVKEDMAFVLPFFLDSVNQSTRALTLGTQVTLRKAANAGTNFVEILEPLSDAGLLDGDVVAINSGVSNQENITISTVSVSQNRLNFTTNLAHNHAAGEWLHHVSTSGTPSDSGGYLDGKFSLDEVVPLLSGICIGFWDGTNWYRGYFGAPGIAWPQLSDSSLTGYNADARAAFLGPLTLNPVNPLASWQSLIFKAHELITIAGVPLYQPHVSVTIKGVEIAINGSSGQTAYFDAHSYGFNNQPNVVGGTPADTIPPGSIGGGKFTDQNPVGSHQDMQVCVLKPASTWYLFWSSGLYKPQSATVPLTINGTPSFDPALAADGVAATLSGQTVPANNYIVLNTDPAAKKFYVPADAGSGWAGGSITIPGYTAAGGSGGTTTGFGVLPPNFDWTAKVGGDPSTNGYHGPTPGLCHLGHIDGTADPHNGQYAVDGFTTIMLIQSTDTAQKVVGQDKLYTTGLTPIGTVTDTMAVTWNGAGAGWTQGSAVRNFGGTAPSASGSLSGGNAVGLLSFGTDKKFQISVYSPSAAAWGGWNPVVGQGYRLANGTLVIVTTTDPLYYSDDNLARYYLQIFEPLTDNTANIVWSVTGDGSLNAGAYTVGVRFRAAFSVKA